MTDTITAGSGYAWVDGYYVPSEITVTLEPTLVLGYQSSRPIRNMVKPILGSSESDVTFRPAGRRTGTLSLLFTGDDAEVTSEAAETTLALGGVFSLNSDDRATVEMAFVLSSSINRELDPTTRRAWVVAFEYQEVAP